MNSVLALFMSIGRTAGGEDGIFFNGDTQKDAQD